MWHCTRIRVKNESVPKATDGRHISVNTFHFTIHWTVCSNVYTGQLQWNHKSWALLLLCAGIPCTVNMTQSLSVQRVQHCRRMDVHLTHWRRVTHICVSKRTIIGSDNSLSPGRRQTIIWTNAGILLIRNLGTNFSEILIEIITFSFKKMRLKVSSAKRRPFWLGLNVLTTDTALLIGPKQEWWTYHVQISSHNGWI